MEHGMTINCETARIFMDRVNSLSSSEEEQYHQHLASCHQCAEEERIEFVLRDVIVPETVPALSNQFEQTLMLKLGLSARPAVQFRPSPVWGWIAATVTLLMILLPFYGSYRYILKISALLFHSGLTILKNIDYFVVSYIQSLPSLPSVDSLLPAPYGHLMVPLLFGSIVLVSGVMGIGAVLRR